MGFFTVEKKTWKNRKISLRAMIRILEAMVTEEVKYGSETWAIRKAKELFGKSLVKDFRQLSQKYENV